jgi:hypothetical protein
MSRGKALQSREIKRRQVSAGDAGMLGSTVATGVTRSEVVVLETGPERIQPDLRQSRRALPRGLHARLQERRVLRRDAMKQLLEERESNAVARRILEGEGDTSALLA